MSSPSDTPISGLPTGADSDGSEPVPVVQAGSTVRLSVLQILRALLQSWGSSIVGYVQAGAGMLLRTVQAKLREQVSTKDAGAVADGVTSDAVAVAAANAQAAAIGAALRMQGVHHIGSPITITVPIIDTLAQIFSLTSQVTISNGLPVRPEWFGIANVGAFYAAIQALPALGGVVMLEVATYFCTAATTTGSGAPARISASPTFPFEAARCRALRSIASRSPGAQGTIIQGPLMVFANNFEISDLGVDSGFNVCTTYNGGNATPGSFGEGLELTYPNDASKAANGLCERAHLHNIIALSHSPTAPTHAMILGEGYANVRVTGEIIAIYGTHGAAIKCADFNMDKISTYLNAEEGVVLKSDTQTTAICQRVQISQITAEAGAPVGTTPYAGASGTGAGLSIQALGNSMDEIQIGQLRIHGYPTGVQPLWGSSTPSPSAGLKLNPVIYDGFGAPGSTSGMNFSSTAGQSFVRGRIGSFAAKNCTYAAQVYLAAPSDIDHHLSIGRLTGTNVQNVLDIGSQSYVSINQVFADTAIDAVYHIVGTPSLKVGIMSKDVATTSVYSTVAGGLAPALSNGWTQVGGTDPFGVDLIGGRVCLRGLIAPGANNSFMTLPQWAWPLTTKRFVAFGNNAGVTTAVQVNVQSDGHCFVNEFAGTTTNCTTWLSLSGLTYDMQA